MKKVKKNAADMAKEYDFRGGIRGKYAKRYSQGTNIIVLEPGIAKMFPDSKTVNNACAPWQKPFATSGKGFDQLPKGRSLHNEGNRD